MVSTPLSPHAERLRGWGSTCGAGSAGVADSLSIYLEGGRDGSFVNLPALIVSVSPVLMIILLEYADVLSIVVASLTVAHEDRLLHRVAVAVAVARGRLVFAGSLFLFAHGLGLRVFGWTEVKDIYSLKVECRSKESRQAPCPRAGTRRLRGRSKTPPDKAGSPCSSKGRVG